MKTSICTVKINNSYSKVEHLDQKTLLSLKRELSYSINSYSQHTRRISLLKRDGTFPTGLLSRVQACLFREKVPYQLVDQRTVPAKQLPARLDLGSIKPHIGQVSALARTEINERGTVSMPTGTGKSILIALIASRLNLKTLVVVPTTLIKQQLIASFRAFKIDLSRVVVENIDSTKLRTLTDFDVLIIDEAHHVGAKTYHKLNKTAWTKIYYRYFVTATPFRNNPEETLLFEALAGDVVYEMTYPEAVNAGLIVPVQAYYYDLPKQDNDFYTYAEVYSNLIVRNDSRNKLLADVLADLAQANKKTLCLVREIEHGKELERLAGIPFVSGEDKESKPYVEAFNTGRLRSIIGTTGILGEGVDTKPCEFVVIAGLGKAKSAFLQQVGRAVRAYPGKEIATVILFRDTSHKFTLRHFRAQCKILKEYHKTEPRRIK